MGILSGPVFGMDQLLQLVQPLFVGGALVLAAMLCWFAIGAVINMK